MRKSWSLAFGLSTLLAFAGVCNAATIETSLRDNVGIGEVSGGEKSNPLWESEIGNHEFRGALRKSLDSAGVLERARGEGRYVLSALLESIDIPNTGVLLVTTHVTYKLTDKKSGQEVYCTSIAGEYTAQQWDSLLHPRILKEASTAAFRANTGRLAESLRRMSPSRQEVTSLQ
jgi:hypothetical protein